MRSRPSAIVLLLSALFAPGVEAAGAGGIFVCDFPRAGRMVIDTRVDDPSITWNGVRYPTQSGSYFFQGTDAAPLVDGDPIVALFGPGFAYWGFRGERSHDCERRAGPPPGRAGGDDRRLEGMDYHEARAIVVDEYGWVPLRGSCEGAGAAAEACAAFPEIDVCAGTGLGRCVMRFERPGRCLIVGTVGGPPDGTVDGEPSVEDVTFLDGGCP